VNSGLEWHATRVIPTSLTSTSARVHERTVTFKTASFFRSATMFVDLVRAVTFGT